MTTISTEVISLSALKHRSARTTADANRLAMPIGLAPVLQITLLPAASLLRTHRFPL